MKILRFLGIQFLISLIFVWSLDAVIETSLSASSTQPQKVATVVAASHTADTRDRRVSDMVQNAQPSNAQNAMTVSQTLAAGQKKEEPSAGWGSTVTKVIGGYAAGCAAIIFTAYLAIRTYMGIKDYEEQRKRRSEEDYESDDE